VSQANEPARLKLQLSCIQFEPVIGDVAGNLARSCALIRAAAASGSRLIVLPELANTGYVFETMEEALGLAEPVPDVGPPALGFSWLGNSKSISSPASPSATATRCIIRRF
jgi:hypothetical protein